MSSLQSHARNLLMRLWLVRHGKTFLPNEAAVFLGRHQDAALTDAGITQADAVAAYFKTDEVKVKAAYVSGAQRTRVFAERIREANQDSFPIVYDARLDEVDYGAWTGLTADAVISAFGQEAYNAYQERGIWPKGAGFVDDPHILRNETLALSAELIERHVGEDVLVVGHNGRLRDFLALAPELTAFRKEAGEHKIACGHLALLTYEESARWRVN
ncbi:MAG: histidine phosphatase family protein, partial [Oxalobacteraceae bacterium]